MTFTGKKNYNFEEKIREIDFCNLDFFFFAETINNEPQIGEFKLGPASEKDLKITTLISDLQSLLRQEVTGQSTNLTCRSIRIGSYKTLAKEKVYFTQKAIYIRVPYLTDSKRMITLVIPATGKERKRNYLLP